MPPSEPASTLQQSSAALSDQIQTLTFLISVDSGGHITSVAGWDTGMATCSKPLQKLRPATLPSNTPRKPHSCLLEVFYKCLLH